MASKMDRIHDEFQVAKIRKSGTRYERLTAIVLQLLQRSAVVVHDVRLRGEDTGVPHQIDVVVERSGGRARVLVECKDFDKGDPVGLGIVRDFWGAVDDIKPDDAFIVTTNGFTPDAIQFAAGKSIRLCSLRVVEEEEWTRRLRTFHLRRGVVGVSVVNHKIVFPTVDLAREFGRACGHVDVEASATRFVTINNLTEDTPLRVTGESSARPLHEFLLEEATAGVEADGAVQKGTIIQFTVDYQGLSIWVEDHAFPVVQVAFTTMVEPIEEELVFVADGVARLIWSELDARSQMLVFGADLRRFTLDATGTVVPEDG